MKNWLRWLDLTSWDSWFPLGVIGLFSLFAIPAATGVMSFGLPVGNDERLHIIYTEVGLQTTAGIFAIVISLSLVAIQFAAQEYSHRIMEYYIRSVIFWSTIVVYLGIMIMTIILQAGVDDPQSTRAGAIVIVASVLAIVLLVPHFIITAAYLKPEFIVEKLLRRVDDEFLSGLDESDLANGLSSSQDRLLPVVEICERSIDRGDLTTTRAAISRMIGRYEAIPESIQGTSIDNYFIEHLTRMGRKAVAHADEEEAAGHVIRGIETIGGIRSPSLAIERIDILGFMAVRHETEAAIAQMIASLLGLSQKTTDIGATATILTSYQALIHRLIVGDYDRILRQLSEAVESLSKASTRAGAVDDTARALDVLEAIGHDAASAGLVRVVLDVTARLKNAGVSAAESNPDSAQETVLRLLRIERALDQSERDALATLAFARGEVEAAVKRSAPRTSTNPPADDGASGLSGGDNLDASGFSDLWDED
ncbi:MAG: hypothetical protein HQ478_10035 [Chloroflexi bacterium]|nr:hypothetical protein [Chloroflexota bacterium]